MNGSVASNRQVAKQGGAGIGLRWSKNWSNYYGGSVAVKSASGEGSTFTVRLRLGSEHLQDDLVETPSSPPSRPPNELSRAASPHQALVHIDGALDPRLEPGIKGNSSQSIPVLVSGGGHSRAHILIAEDNVDLRKFLQELLAPYYNVTAA